MYVTIRAKIGDGVIQAMAGERGRGVYLGVVLASVLFVVCFRDRDVWGSGRL